MNRKKNFILYARQSVDAALLVTSVLRWAKRRGYAVSETIVDSNQKQHRLRQLLNRKGVTVLCPDIYHFSGANRLPYFLAHSASVIFVRERLHLKRGDRNSNTAFRLVAAMLAAEKSARSHHVRQSLLLSKLLGVRLGRPPVATDIRRRALTLLREGKSLSSVVKGLDGKISKSTVQSLAQELKKPT